MGVPNPFKTASNIAPAIECVAVTPSDTVDLAVEARALYIGTAGDVEIHDSRGNLVVFTAMVGGTYLHAFVKRVLDGNTTASNIVALI